ncbi:MAG: beta-lactamase family protein, partial [Chloroflexota bacterium]|nr:beta-lactamase family protein [Chloroflexota bacterium]
ADASTGRLVDGETLFTTWSAGKGVAATVMHLLADRDRLAYHAPIADYWPEFGAHGKQAITVAHALTHTSGIPQIPDGVGPAELLDWETMCRLIGDLVPLWPPGSATGYHAMTYGWIIGELARRVDGRPFAVIVEQDICAPLGIDGLFFGIPPAVEQRVAVLEEAPASATTRAPATNLGVDVVPPWRNPASAWANRPEVRRACLPSSGAIANARSLARHYAVLAAGELDQVRLLPPERIQRASALAVAGMDLVLGVPVRRALGYHLGEPLSAMSERITAFGHAGAGGTIGFADPAYRFAFALTKNRMVNALPGQDVALLVAREVRAGLGIPETGAGRRQEGRARPVHRPSEIDEPDTPQE